MPEPTLELATLGGGCFWCVEAALENVLGVNRVVSGYAGGKNPNPTYEQVCTGTTNHAEVVQVTFRPEQISFRELVQFFFVSHDPTTLNRQGADAGTQYRSVIFFHSPEQEATARDVIAELDAAKIWGRPIVTEVSACPTFYPAEGYHQGYFRDNGQQPYCQAVIAPKVAKLRKAFAAKMKPA